MWREIVNEFTSAAPQFPVEPGVLDRIEVALGQRLPQDLHLFLLESNGMEGKYGTGVIWPAERILSDNLSFRENDQYRSLYMPFDSLIFFGDNGGGGSIRFRANTGTR
ncbi:SMI1/KNR4 family protein [Streptomyces sp. NPDC087263]|uniref:SMI1/KNR4 family protein n=1 Tax=Streptomyces sp. NPDC087263 TaxID=3365773 RepID=UPI0038188DD1